MQALADDLWIGTARIEHANRDTRFRRGCDALGDYPVIPVKKVPVPAPGRFVSHSVDNGSAGR